MMKILIPAEPRVLGILLFELHAAISEIGRRKVEAGLSGPDDLQEALLESKKLLKETVELLKHEPPELPEGKILIQAKSNLAELDVIMRTVHMKVGDVI
ncbi:MYND finger [Popillia japonica]